MAELVDMGKRLGLALRGWRVTLEELSQTGAPAIVHFRDEHFAVFLDCTAGVVRWLDAGSELQLSPVDEFRNRFSGLALLSDANGPRSGSGLVFAQLHSDVGTTTQPRVSHVFEFENTGAKPLRVVALPYTKGTRTALSKSCEIGPTEKGRVRIEGDVQASAGRHAVKVLSDDDARPVQFLTLTYRKSVPISISPERLHIVCRRGSGHRQVIWLRGPQGLVVTDVEIRNPALSVDLREVTTREVQSTALISVPVHVDGRDPGIHEGDVCLRTSDHRTPSIVIPALVRIEGFVRVSPRHAFVGFVEPNTRVRRRFLVTAANVPDFKVLDVRTDVAGLQIGQLEAMPAGGFAFEIEIPPSHATGMLLQGDIVIHTNVPGEGRVAVPVAGYVVE